MNSELFFPTFRWSESTGCLTVKLRSFAQFLWCVESRILLDTLSEQRN